MQVRYITNVTKVYPDMIKVILYKEPKAIVVSHKQGKRKKRDNFKPTERSVKRSRESLHDLVYCNDFDLFCTFTFDRRKIDRYNINSCYGVISRWLHAQQVNSKGLLKYIVVPERHKDGALHFHALISGFNGRLKDSGHVQNGRKVYNITSYRSGFSTAVKIDNLPAVANYVRKYITKDMIKDFGRKRYFCSKNLQRPEKIVNSSIFKDCLPLGRHHVFDAGDFDVYNLNPDFCKKAID